MNSIKNNFNFENNNGCLSCETCDIDVINSDDSSEVLDYTNHINKEAYNILNIDSKLSNRFGNIKKYHIENKSDLNTGIKKIINDCLGENNFFIGGNNGIISKPFIIEHYDGKIGEYIVIKKNNLNNTGNNEAINQDIFYSNSKNLINRGVYNGLINVKVPKIIGSANVDGFDYIIMEFIKGKTIHTLLWEKILNEKIKELGEKIKDKKLKNNFFDIYNNIKRSFEGKILLEDEDQDIISDLLNILLGHNKDVSENGIVGTKFNEDVQFGWMEYFIDANNDTRLFLFDKNEGGKIKTSLEIFINYFNSIGVYHMDLENLKNLILSDDGNLFVIDFGESRVSIGNLDNKEYKISEYEKGADLRGLELIKGLIGKSNNLKNNPSDIFRKYQGKIDLISEKEIITYSNSLSEELIYTELKNKILNNLNKTSVGSSYYEYIHLNQKTEDDKHETIKGKSFYLACIGNLKAEELIKLKNFLKDELCKKGLKNKTAIKNFFKEAGVLN